MMMISVFILSRIGKRSRAGVLPYIFVEANYVICERFEIGLLECIAT